MKDFIVGKASFASLATCLTSFSSMAISFPRFQKIITFYCKHFKVLLLSILIEYMVSEHTLR